MSTFTSQTNMLLHHYTDQPITRITLCYLQISKNSINKPILNENVSMLKKAAFMATTVYSNIEHRHRILNIMSHVQANSEQHDHPVFSAYPASQSSCQ